MPESHRSHVLVSSNRVYKQLKPASAHLVDMTDALDAADLATTTLNENRRFSPDVYLGHADVYEADKLVDRMIVMRRLDANDQVSNLLGRGSDQEVVKLVARQIAALHTARQPLYGAQANAGAGAAIVRTWLRNLDVISTHAPRVIDQAKFDEVQRLAATYLAGRSKLFRDRVAQGWVRRGHGNLSADNLFITADGPRLLNCDIANQGFQVADALADVARLAVDLDRMVGPRAAVDLLDAWDESAGDSRPSSLGYFYVAFRAHDLCKKACLDYADGDPTGRDRARSFHEQALRYLRLARVRLILVGGGQGTGKSTMAEAISRRTGAVWLQADEIGREVTGAAARADLINTPELETCNLPVQSTVHVEMMRRARRLLQEGASVVLDAPWRDPLHRAEARRLVEETATNIAEVCCTVSARDASDRLDRRFGAMHNTLKVPEGALETAAETFGGWTEAAHIDTSGDIAHSVAAACAAIGLAVEPRRPIREPNQHTQIGVDLAALDTVIAESELQLVASSTGSSS